MWLKQEYGRRCYFPDHTGQFDFDVEVGESVVCLTVEGAPLHQTTTTISPSTSSHSGSQPFYKPIGYKKETTFNVKVVRANMTKLSNGKVEFERLEQTHISLNEHTANVNTVTNAVQSKWGGDYVVVTGDGLPVDDSEGTHGRCMGGEGRDRWAPLYYTPCPSSLFKDCNIVCTPSNLCDCLHSLCTITSLLKPQPSHKQINGGTL